jgi:ribulose-phosphate 3-epimerase
MNKSIRIVPAILTDDARVLETMLKQSETFTDFVQIDIMDSKFVPSRSITWEQIANVRTKLSWEVHLMVEEPEKQIENYKSAGAQKAIFHYEATSTPDYFITLARQLGLSAGLAVNPETEVSQILPLVSKLDSVLFLSVHPGFYGAKFLPEVLKKVKQLRQAQPGLVISIDGGIKENNILEVARCGVDEICVGSAVFMQADPAESFRRLVRLVNE